ncbi:MAG TPA: formate dehydrogenase subunit alpha, partial [Spirochaetota bacterium]|nr:formate dehydrogenase subunit alpha [Spirochaetota bacterium]
CEEGQSILSAAKSVGIEIPVLCYHPEISIIGSCRICVVEIKGEKLLHTACSTPVKNGMVIYTESERVIEARKLVVEMILSQHFGDCLTCDASGECLLEKYSYEFGATGNLFEKNEFDVKIHGIDDKNPFITLDRGKCILCGRCARACDEWVSANAITFVDKGNKLMLGTLYNKGLEDNKECIFCGNCINVCPVGALGEKKAIRAGRLPEVQKIKTICPYCGVGCGLIVYKKNNKIIKVRGDLDSQVSHGRVCIKGKFGLDFVNSKERLTKPLIKNQDGEFEEVELIDALLLIKQKIDETKTKGGHFAGLASARCTNEDNYVFQKFFRTILNSDNVDHCARICHSPSVSGLSMTLGSGAMTNPIEDIDHIDCFFIIGSNMTNTHPVISWKVINRIKQGAILILVDPKKSSLSKYATIHLQINPGSDIFLLNAMMKVIIEERMFDTETIEEKVVGFAEFEESLEKLSFDDLVSQTGIDENDIRLAARLFAISGSSSIYYAMGITQHCFGTANVIALSDLAIICGKVGKDANGINPLRGQNNVQGACDMGCLPGVLPGYKDITDQKSNDLFKNKWNSNIPLKVGKTLTEIISDAGKGKLDFLYIMGENPAISDPDSNAVIESLKNTNFLVVQDIFLTETAMFADVVLPAASFAEKDGTFTNTERRIQKINKVIESPSKDVLPDWMIINRIAELCGVEWNYNSWVDIFNEIRETVEIYSHIDPYQLGIKEYFWPHDDFGESVKRLFENKFNTPDGKARVIFREPPKQIYKKNKEYPYLLIIGRLYEHYHTGTMTRKSEGIEAIEPYSKLLINPKDAIKLKIKNDDWVTIKSEIGEIKTRILISLDVKQSNCFISFHFKESLANALTSKKHLDPVSKMAALKIVSVNLIPDR